ncbi:MAG: hypothetical protein IJJ69_08430 [Oscillospiraceae bacterium]|nr:hypothetical protein [Oscillospiraceae bacterium]
MKKLKHPDEFQKLIQETVSESVRETLKEKTDSLRTQPVSGQILEVFREFCGFSAESAKLLFKAVSCFGVFFTLIYAVHQLIKEIKSPL